MAQEIGDPAAGYSLRPPGWEAALQGRRVVMAPREGGAAVMAIPHAPSEAGELAPVLEQGWSEPGLELRSGPPQTAGGARSVEGVTLGGGIQEHHEVVLQPDGRFEQEGEFVDGRRYFVT